jgi:propionyl-CoA synthetase
VKYTRVLDDDAKPIYRWFAGGQTNVCFNALDRHIATRGNQAALIYDSPLTGTKKTFTYKELKSQVELFAGVLSSAGVRKGDNVIIYMYV